MLEINFDLRWYCDKQHELPISPELFQLLYVIHESGSLRAGAEHCRISYRHAWGLMQKWQKNTGHPLVNMERGKGAKLSPLGLKLLWAHKHVSARLEPDLASMASEISHDLNELLQQGNTTKLKICASHGLAVARLRDLAQADGLSIDLQFHGSLDSLRLYKEGSCDLAGFHIPESPLGMRLLSRFRRYLNAENDMLIYAVRRRQGLMMAAGNPLEIYSLVDLTRDSVRFINRQQNSGTRTTFDLLLADARIEETAIKGYENEEFTHMAVAALVAGGAADCAFGIETAAKRFNLHFIPFNWERYWFVANKQRINSTELGKFIALLSSAAFKQEVLTLSGYESHRSGEVVMLDESLNQLLI